MMRNASTWALSVVPSDDRNLHDFYETSPGATEALLRVERFEGLIHEPACGRGAISEVLRAAKYRVRSTDLIDRGYGKAPVDYLACSGSRWRAANVVTNLPYRIAEAFAAKALELADRKVALLCRLAWLEGQRRGELFDSTPLARVHVFRKRPAMHKGGAEVFGQRGGSGGMIAFAWFVWEKGHDGPPCLDWV